MAINLPAKISESNIFYSLDTGFGKTDFKVVLDTYTLLN